MPKARNTRKARFLGALRIAGITMSQWATKEGVTQGYVSNLLAGRRTHDVLNKKIDDFTEKHVGKVAA
jgi:hypothetical protein